MNQNSLDTYYNEENQRTFNSHKAKIVRELRKAPGLSRWQLSSRLGINNHGIQKRLSDLSNDGIVEICGTTLYRGNPNSLYKVKDQLPLFPIEKTTLRKWLKYNYPNIMHEFEILQEKAL